MGVSLFISKMQHTLYVSVFAGLSKSTCNRLANIMKCDNGEKTVVTTDFCHSNKKYYSQKEIEKSGYNCLHVPSYGRNLSLARIWSHLVFGDYENSSITYLRFQTECIVPCQPVLQHSFALNIVIGKVYHLSLTSSICGRTL